MQEGRCIPCQFKFSYSLAGNLLLLCSALHLLYLLRQPGQEDAYVCNQADGLGRSPVHELGHCGGIDVHADGLDIGGQQISDGDGVQHGAQHYGHVHALKSPVHGVLGPDGIGDDLGQGPVIANGAGQDVVDALLRGLIHDAPLELSLRYGVLYRAAGHDLADGIKVVSVAARDCVTLAVHPQAGAEELPLDVMHRHGVSG